MTTTKKLPVSKHNHTGLVRCHFEALVLLCLNLENNFILAKQKSTNYKYKSTKYTEKSTKYKHKIQM